MIMLALAAMTAAGTEACRIRSVHLRCEYLANPIGVAAAAPRLSWELEATGPTVRAERQTAYRIRAASALSLLRRGRPDLWDTDRVASDASAHIPYAGRSAPPGKQIWWQVKVWDAEGRESAWTAPAHWTPGPDAWKARWIGDPVQPPAPVPAHNGYHSALTDDPGAGKWIAVDLGEARLIDRVRLWPAKPYDWQPETPGFLFPLRFRIEVAASPEGPFTVVVDRTAEDEPSPGTEARTYAFHSLTARIVRLTATQLRQRDPGHYGLALAEMEAMSGDQVVSRGARVEALDSIESGGWRASNLTDGDTVSHPADGDAPLPPIMLRRAFTLDRVPERAVLFASALGVYEVRINGNRVGDRILAPEWTDYGRRVQYQGYDVTALLRQGSNVIAAVVGDGWYAGRIGLFPGRGHYGRRPELRAQLMTDGEPRVATDGSWRITTDGPIRSSDILDGEVYDARREMPGWDEPGFDDSAWAFAAEYEHPQTAMVPQPNEPIRVTRELPAVALSEPQPGVYVFDLGQNMVGWVRLRLRAPSGTVVRLGHAEMLKEDGTIYTANLRGAPQRDWYTCKGGGVETFEPHFTYHGFRYVEVTGLPKKPALEDLTGRVFHSSAPEVGAFACSNARLNRLWQNIVWTQRANLMSTPTDCPQRDERLGWMGDIQAFGPTACFNMDLAGFFTKWFQDIRDAQADDGRFPDFAPNPGDSNVRFSGVPAWGDAGVILPWLVYTTYGDRGALEAHYDAARRWVEYVLAANPDLIWRNGRNADYNDWLNGDTLIAEGWPRKGGEVPREVSATAFWANSVRLVARMASVLGRADDAARFARLFEDIRDAFRRSFVRPDGTIEGDTQAGYALALHFDLLDEKARIRAVKRMIEGIEAYGGHISTGIQSTHRMMLELTGAGRSDVAYRLLMTRTFPSWLYSVDNGATTIWERWDGFVKGRGFQDPGMNSFNHWALGAVGQWMVEVILGLRPHPEAVGWRRFIVRPEPGGGLTHARGAYRAMPGLIRTGWKMEKERFVLDLTVPPNCAAEVHLPTDRAEAVTESGAALAGATGVRVVGVRDRRVVLEVGSGTYRFASPRP